MTHRPDHEPPPRSALPGVFFAAGTCGLTVTWFVVSWLVLHSPVVDAIGEALGGMAVVLLVLSIVGVVRSR